MNAEPRPEQVASDVAAEAAARKAASVRRPPKSAPKDEWVDYAEARGVARGDAEAMSKSELVEQFSEE